MIHKHSENEYLLDRPGVDAVSEQVGEWLKKAGYQKENIIRLRIAMEELLLLVCEHFDKKMTGTLLMTKRLGTPILRFRYRGEEFNPYEPKTNSLRQNGQNADAKQTAPAGTEQEQTGSLGSEADEYVQMMLSRLGLTPEWSYRAGVNEITLRGPRQTLRSEFWLIGAAVAALIIGLMPVSLPAALHTGLLEYLFKPIADTFIHAVNAFVGLMIFLSVVSGICSIGSVTDFSRMGRHVIFRLIRNSFLTSLFGAVVLLPFFRFGNNAAASGESQIGEIVSLLFSIVPSNPITPFAEGNMIQVVFLAVMLGIALLILGENVAQLKSFVEQANAAVTQILGAICKLLPLYIFVSLVVLFKENGTGVLLQLWKPIVISFVINALLLLIKLVITSIKLHLPAGLLLKKILPTVLVGLFTASSSAAYGKISELNEKELGIAPEMNRFALPFANLLSGGVAGVGLIIIIYYLSESSGAALTFGGWITLWFMCSMFGLTMPPVSGGMLICLGMVMTQLNIPQTGIAIGGVLSILFDFFMTAAKIGGTHLELMMDADHFHMLDRSITEKI